MSFRMTMKFDEGWDILQKGIAKHIRILEELPEPQFTSEENMLLYTIIYNMCTQKPPHDYSHQLYDNCREAFKAYITSTVLPALREKHGEFMLRELLKRWINHKVMVRWFTRTFDYLDRYFIVRRSLPGLHEVGLDCFHDLIIKKEINGKIKDAVISMIDREREGEQIDRALLKNILDIFMEIGVGQMKPSCPDYMLKAEDCLKKDEKDRVEEVQHQLANQLLEKENSESHALLRDDKELGVPEQSL